MRAYTIALIAATATLGIAACTQETETPTEPIEQVEAAPMDHSGPAVGEAIPANFLTRDTSGAERSLNDLSGENGLVLVFNRSADWCSYCQGQMVDLRAIQGDLEQRGYTLATLSYDAPDILADFAERDLCDKILIAGAMIDCRATATKIDINDLDILFMPSEQGRSLTQRVLHSLALAVGYDLVRARLPHVDHCSPIQMARLY